MHKPYDHKAVMWIDEDGLHECRICGASIIGVGQTLRHINEAIRPRDITPADRDVVAEFTEVGARALEQMWTDRCSDLDRARVVVEALYEVGALHTGTKRRRVRAAA